MLNAASLPPHQPPTPLELIALCLENPAVTKEAIRDVALEISGYNAKTRALELARQQHEQHVQADREQLARERGAVEAEIAERRAVLAAEISAFETVKAAVAADREYVRRFIVDSREYLARDPLPWAQAA